MIPSSASPPSSRVRQGCTAAGRSGTESDDTFRYITETSGTGAGEWEDKEPEDTFRSSIRVEQLVEGQWVQVDDITRHNMIELVINIANKEDDSALICQIKEQQRLRFEQTNRRLGVRLRARRY
jgi:hypothetical protein